MYDMDSCKLLSSFVTLAAFKTLVLSTSKHHRQQIFQLKSEIKELEDKVDDLENRSRRNNLCFEGISESAGENWQQTENKLKELISTYMPEVRDDVVIERAHGVGKTRPSEAKPRKIVARFFNYKDRETILKAKKNLHGTNIFINEDYSDRVMKKRNDLMTKLKEARKKI